MVKANASSAAESAAAAKIYSLFSPVTRRLKYFVTTRALLLRSRVKTNGSSSFRDATVHDMEDCLESVHNCLDDVWKIEEVEYPQTRMEHLLEIVGDGIVRRIQRATKSTRVWAGNCRDNVELLNTCQRACRKWVTTCEQLTVLYWPNYSHHKWVGPKYSPENLIAFSDHVEEVRELEAPAGGYTIIIVIDEVFIYFR